MTTLLLWATPSRKYPFYTEKWPKVRILNRRSVTIKVAKRSINPFLEIEVFELFDILN